jgi:hypothetical protein
MIGGLMTKTAVRQKRKYTIRPENAAVVTEAINLRVDPTLRRQLERRGCISNEIRKAMPRYYRLMDSTKQQLRVLLKDPKEQRALVKAYRNGGEEALLRSAVRFTDVQKIALLDCVERYCAAEDSGAEINIRNLLE